MVGIADGGKHIVKVVVVVSAREQLSIQKMGNNARGRTQSACCCRCRLRCALCETAAGPEECYRNAQREQHARTSSAAIAFSS